MPQVLRSLGMFCVEICCSGALRAMLRGRECVRPDKAAVLGSNSDLGDGIMVKGVSDFTIIRDVIQLTTLSERPMSYNKAPQKEC